MRLSALPLICIAEPLPDERDLYADYFRWSGFRVHVAATGQEALDYIARDVPDIVSACFHLADMDGAELCSAVKRAPASCNVPVLLLATRASSADITRAMAAGCTEVLLKPVLPEQLLLEVRKLVPASRLGHAAGQRSRLRTAKTRVRTGEAAQTAAAIMKKLDRRRKLR